MGTRKSVRDLNGYRVIYAPNHPRAMTSENWQGYVYEHVVVAEEDLGRPLLENELVHHLDSNRANNRSTNLLVISRDQHAKLEHWLSCGAPSAKVDGENRKNSVNAKWIVADFCMICGKTLQAKQKNCCSFDCNSLFAQKVERPTKEALIEDLTTMSLVRVGKKYGVSDNAVRKWMKRYKIHKTTLSRATDTLVEGAETTGEVQPS
jgi:predicted nucleic acid-binding Zn ribbon protein